MTPLVLHPKASSVHRFLTVIDPLLDGGKVLERRKPRMWCRRRHTSCRFVR